MTFKWNTIDNNRNLVMIKCNLKLKFIFIKNKKYINYWQTDKWKEKRINSKFKEYAYIVMIQEGQVINNLWTILKKQSRMEQRKH